MNSSYAEDSSRIYREWPYLGYPAVPGFEFRPAQHLGLRSPCCLPRYQPRVNVPLWDIR